VEIKILRVVVGQTRCHAKFGEDRSKSKSWGLR